jgi:hypothetical protein
MIAKRFPGGYRGGLLCFERCRCSNCANISQVAHQVRRSISRRRFNGCRGSHRRPTFVARDGSAGFIENRSGAGSVIGLEAVAKSPPDGYTILSRPIFWQARRTFTN